MGLFQKIRYNRRAKEAGGAFGVTAQNMAAIYYAIPFTPYGIQLTERQRLAAAALITSTAYYNKGKIIPEHIEKAIELAKTGELALWFTKKKHRTNPQEENAMLVGVTMQMLARMLKASSNDTLSYEFIIDSVIENKPLIAKMIKKTLVEGSASKAYADCVALVNETCAIPEFQAIINAF